MTSAKQDEECEDELDSSSPLKRINCYISRLVKRIPVDELASDSNMAAIQSVVRSTASMWRTKIRPEVFNVIGTLLAYKVCQLNSTWDYVAISLDTMHPSDSEARQRLTNLLVSLKDQLITQRSLIRDAHERLKTFFRRLMDLKITVLNHRVNNANFTELETNSRNAIVATGKLRGHWITLLSSFNSTVDRTNPLLSSFNSTVDRTNPGLMNLTGALVRTFKDQLQQDYEVAIKVLRLV